MRTLSAALAQSPDASERPCRPLSPVVPERLWLLSSSAGAFLVLCAGAGLTYCAQLVIARTIGAHGFGTYAYVVAWVTLTAYVTTLGFHTSLLRLLPAYEALGAWPLARGVLRCAILMTLVLSFLMALMIIVSARALARGDLGMFQAFRIAALAVPLIALQLVISAGARAFGGPVVALIPERILRDGIALLLVGGAGAIGTARPDATFAVVALLVGCGVALVFAMIALRLLRPSRLVWSQPETELREWFAPAIPLTILLFADNVLVRSGVLVLGIVGSVRDAGLFAIAFSMALLVALPRMAIASAFAPQVSALYARNDVGGLRGLTARSALLSLIVTILVAISLLVATPTLLRWLGPSFMTATPSVVILMSGQVFAAAFGPQQHLLTMTGHERASAAIFLGSATFSLVACFALIPILGVTGAALATVGSTVLLNAAMAWVIWRYLSLPPGVVIALSTSFSRGRQNHAG